MDPFEPELLLKKEVRFSESLTEANPNPEKNFRDVFGGIIKSGQWGWLTKGSSLRITSLRTGQLISKFEFDDSNGFGVCIITCVSEIQLPYLTDSIIAIGIQYADCPGGLCVIYSVEESTVIRCIELKHKITCCKFIGQEVSQHTVLQNMNGCLAIGTDSGSVLLVDLNLRGDEMNASVAETGVSVVPCHIVDYSMSLLHLHRHFQHCQQEGVHFAIQLEVLDNAKFIQSLLPIDLILSLAVGLADGRLVLYDLTDMQVFYVAPPQEKSSPLVKMNFMEPPDDPRSCVYIWAFHENYQNSMAVMHSLMYEKRVVAEDGFCYFENFQVSCVRLLLPLNCAKSVPITCQAITKAPSHGNEETISLCALVWKQDDEIQTEVLLFDINQWYKEEMPYVGDWREEPSYLASFVFKGLSSLEMYFNPNTISLFNSIQRPEEHFYPVSLSFDTIALGENKCVHLNWPGAQNRVINVLRSKGSLALLDPNPLFREILNTRLLPQFSGMNYKSTFSLKAKRETLLSVAIEQNCIGLLKECAKNWSDGSHQGKSLIEGLSMSTLTDWLWTRASCIKERCNSLGQVLFNHSGCTLDQREQKELGYISRQLKTLADLLSEIIAKFGESIPSDVLTTLESQGKSIRMASDYQEILLWLLNIGLLPEASRSTRHREVELNLVPYPYESLRTFYDDRRVEFTRPYEKFSSRKTRGCYLLFIDSFIEHEFKGNSLRDSWQESGGDGLYPPTSIQSMLRIMLIPEVTFENKCALFLYFFLDLNMAIEDKRYEAIVQNFIKFPSVFKLSASLIKQIQAFWNLDHCRFQAAVDEFISPFNKDQVCPQWQLELFLESLLAQNEANLALRVLEAKPSPTSPVLQLNTYLANDLISEAFHFARSKQDEDLLKLFFTTCLCTGKFGVIRDLALTESEGNLVQSLLKNSKSQNAENLHFVYLLQKYKYIEAVSYLDELSKGRVIQRAVDVDTPTLVLSAYNTTMTPVTKGLSDVYLKIKNKIKSKEVERSSPYPLSCQLIKQNANDLLGGIYHSSALGAHFASHYWERHQSEGNTLQQSINAPFLRRPQLPSSYSDYNQQESISYPDPYKAAQKRRLDNSSAEEDRNSKMRENPKKRRKIYDRSDLESIYRPLSREQPTSDNLLTHFKNVPTHSQDMTNYTRKLQKTPPKDMPSFLETPYVKNTVVDASSNETSRRVPEKPGTSLQGILKVSHSNPKSSTETRRIRSVSVESEKRERKDAEEEKSIRFILPSVEDESEEQIDVEMESNNDEEQLQEEIPQSLSRHAGPAKRKSLRSYSSFMSSSRVVQSRSPLLKKSGEESSPEEPPSKVNAVARKTTEYRESDEHQSADESAYSIGRRSALQTVRTEDSEDELFITAQTPSIERASDEDSEEESVSEAIQPSIVITESSNLEKIRTADSEKQRPWNTRISPRSAVGSRPSLRSVETEHKSSSVTPVKVTEPKWLLRTDDSEEQTTFSGIDTTDRVRNIPIVLLDENYYSEAQPKSASESENIRAAAQKTPKRALSVSSEERTTDSTHFVQQRAKQLKGRGSIHSSFSDITTHDASIAPKSEMQTKSNPHSTGNIAKTDTIIDFQPQGSSSRVCATESKFNIENKESVNISESESKFHSEKVTSKATFAERSTVVGGLTFMPTIETTEHVTDTFSVTIQPRDQMLDTTVDMTLYDTLGFDQTHQKLPSESSNSQHQGDDSNISPFDEPSDESGSVILLSSRSSSRTYYEECSVNSENGTQEPKIKQIIIDDEEDDDEIDDEIDILVSDVSEEHSNSFSNQFGEVSVTRTSTSCSIPSNTDTVLSSAAELETEAVAFRRPVREVEDGDEISNENKIFAEGNVNLIDEEEIEGPTTISGEQVTTKTTIVVESGEDNDKKENESKRARLIDINEESQPEKEEEEEEEIQKVKELKNTVVEDTEEEQIVDIQKTTHKSGQIRDAKNEPEKSESKEDNNQKLDSDTMLEQSTTEGQAEERVEDQITEEQLTPNPRRKRSQSFSKTINTETEVGASPSSSRRHSRSGSMPPSSGHQIVTRRRSLLLDSLNENVTPDSPSSRTRSKIRSDSIDVDVDSPSVSNVKRTRLSSVSSVTSIEQAQQTPKSRRRSSMSVEKDLGSTPKSVVTPRATRARSITAEVITTPITTPRRLSVSRKNDSPTDETSLVGTPRATRARSITTEVTTTPKRTPRRLSVSKKNDSPTDQTNLVSSSKGESKDDEVIENLDTESVISQSDDYKSSRRLTRTQLAVLEKSSALAAQNAKSPVRITRRRPSRSSQNESPSKADAKESDTESISSQVSHLSNSTSSRRVTRSSALKENGEDDVISVASSTESGRRRRKRIKEVASPSATLTAIPEEDPSGSEGSLANSQTSKRSRHQKK